MKSFFYRWCAALARGWSGIHLIDKCLLLIMVLLLLQSGITLLVRAPTSAEAAQIDGILRTSAAGIFGYFISANFRAGRGTQGNAQACARTADKTADAGTPRAQIGFGESGATLEPGRAAGEGEVPPLPPCRTQILVVTGIGITSLVILLVARDLVGTSPAVPAALSQLRDFVSGAVGFLIGTPTGNERR